jgi:hypothetical protein
MVGADTHINVAALTNTNISYGAMYGNMCNGLPLQADLAMIRNLSESLDVCWKVEIEFQSGGTKLDNGTIFNFLLGVKKRT